MMNLSASVMDEKGKVKCDTMICGKMYNQKCFLSRHMKKKHADERSSGTVNCTEVLFKKVSP